MPMCGVGARRFSGGAAVGVVALALCTAASVNLSAAPRQVDLSRARGPQTEASAAIDPRDPSTVLAASQNGFTCAVRVYSSRNGGRSWQSSKLATPGAQATGKARDWHGHVCAGNEWVDIDAEGGQYLAFVAGDVALASRGWTLFVARRVSNAARWQRPTRVDVTDAGHDDKPILTADTSAASPHQGRIYVGWTRYLSDGARAVLIAHSDDRGGSWSSPTKLGEGWGVHLAVARTGTLYASWWGSDGMMELSQSSDGGNVFSTPRAFLSLVRAPSFGSGLVPAMRREVVHPNPSLDVDRSGGRFAGRLYAGVSVAASRGRVIKLTVFDSRGRKLFARTLGGPPPRRSRDSFNPAVAVDQSNGTVWLCFYLTGTGVRRILATYSCSSSRDGGFRWTKIRPVASVPSNETQSRGFRTPSGIDSEYASYEGLAAGRGFAYAVWTDTRKLKGAQEEIYGARVSG